MSDSPVQVARSAIAERVGALRLRSRREHLFVAAGVVLAVGLVVLLLTRMFGGHGEATAGPSVPVAADVGDPAVVVRISDGRNGAPLALASGRPLFPLSASSSLESFGDAAVEMHGVRVQGLPTEAGFWAGDGIDQRVFVSVGRGAVVAGAIRPSTLSEGQAVNVSGRFVDLPGLPAAVGVRDADADFLRRQGKVVDANSVRVPQ